jgi:hypothetical protein
MATDQRTLEQIDADFRLREYGVCSKCGKPLEYGEKFIDVESGICGQSQGYPMAWMDGKSLRYHLPCFVLMNA